MSKKISIVVPFFNEEKNLSLLYPAINKGIEPLSKYTFEFIFVDDGSTDKSYSVIEELAKKDARIIPIQFSRNFGKEYATTAGIRESKGDAVIMLDADLQYPPELIPKFVEKWEQGAEVVIGVRTENNNEGFIKRQGSRLFYFIMNLISDTEILSKATDFRLMDRIVVDEFNKLSEHSRITRGLIDWLGFRRETIPFVAPERKFGIASYDFIKLLDLGITSFVSHSTFPLRLAGYVGFCIVLVSLPLGIFMFLSRYIFTNFYNFSGTAILAVIMLFLIGVVLCCLGLVALYIANINTEVSSRPLYVIRKKK